MRKLIERVSSRPYYRETGSDHVKHDAIQRDGVDCTMCGRYPCFKGIDGMASNLAITCHDFELSRKPFNP